MHTYEVVGHQVTITKIVLILPNLF